MSKRKRALVTGITGQDGSYLAELLLEKDYEVHGLIRRSSSINTHRIDHLYEDPHVVDRRLILHYGDMSDSARLARLIDEVRPAEVYNLGAQSHVKVSFEAPEYTSDVDALGTLRLLEAIYHCDPSIRLYQASTSELFGSAPPPQSETTRRGETFVTRKITRAVARIVAGHQDAVYLGNLDAKRDWGYAPDYVRAMWMMLQQPAPTDLVFSTGEQHSVREFAELAFRLVGLDWEKYVRIDRAYLRPAEVDTLLGDSTRARDVLGWKPAVSFAELVRLMVEADLKAEGLDPHKVMKPQETLRSST